ncbi:carotenoid oxygenase family protein [Mycobacterium sp. IS-3022]|uniref:carotenoid oxygenase family protein n=1 Tax=Mycobacterium sp. IS-3022 TaxID=1772277 RepID=UPI0007417C02|nr:carotenoid oxygenase family protein [Mycobacterium sp. IS-3022]KUI01806.1 dioxygenase [Mycobacterium sp. IS-3022]
MTSSTSAIPDYLTGIWAPVPDEIEARDLPVTGALPPQLSGRYFRNGSNPRPGEDPGNLFMGHGMVHGVRLRDGRAEWYRNRWVRTRALEGHPFVRRDGTLDYTAVPANTHVLNHGGKLLALAENGFPYEITDELDTVGPHDYGGKLQMAMTAHPKTDPVTGDLHAFGYGAVPPFVTYYRVSAEGELVTSMPIEVPGPTMMHDIAITERYVIFLDLPMVFQPDLHVPYRWSDEYGSRLGVMPMDRPGEVRWFEIDPCYIFHVGNAYEDEAGRIVVDNAHYAPADMMALWDNSGGTPLSAATGAASGTARMHRITLDLATGAVHEEQLDDRGIEFPTVDDVKVGRPSRYVYTVANFYKDGAIMRHDLHDGKTVTHELGDDVVAGEAVFVPDESPDRAEDDGWLISITTRRDGSASQMLVLDATDVGGEPVATVTLPRGVPAGFHGVWIPDEES